MKQQQLTFEKGMTNVPSDLVCSDHCLEYSEGLIYRDGEHHVIQRPALATDIGDDPAKRLVFVHKLGNGEEVYIYEYDNSLIYKYGVNIGTIYGSGHAGEPLKCIDAVGNTLIASFDGRLGYFLFSGNSYTDIGDIPTPEVHFRMGMDPEEDTYGYDVVSCSGNPEGIIGYNGTAVEPDIFYIKKDGYGGQDKYNNLVVGLYSKNLKTIKEKKGFAEPFCARAALKLYDGSYTHMTNPVMLYPAITRNTSAYNAHGEFTLYTNYSYLYCKLATRDYSQWSDIVKDVVVFITDGVNVYETSVDQPYTLDEYGQKIIHEVTDRDEVLTDCIAYSTHGNTDKIVYTETHIANSSEQADRRWQVLKERTVKEIEDDMVGQSVYYLLCSLGTEQMNDFVAINDKIDTQTLDVLTTQEQLPYDDYYSNSPMKASFLQVYNSRLNISGVERGFFEGYNEFMPWDNSDVAVYTAYVTIKTQEGMKVISHEYQTQQKQGIWFYYPDPRATHVVIKKVLNNNTTYVCDADLTEHPGLNGSYYFNGIGHDEEAVTVANPPTPTPNATESLGGYVLTSEVNNPFVFLASGYNRIGSGTVIGMASQTQALSQGQFGQYPLLVFTTEGIWAMSLDNTGQFVTSHPMSREVALESNPAITPVDGAVFFVSKKGLMVVSGSEVRCVSEQMSGKTGTAANGLGHFCKYLESAFIAYDYRDSLLWLFDKNGNRHCYVFSMKSGTFATYDFGTYVDDGVTKDIKILNVVNDYPDYLLQDNRGVVFTLMGRDNVNDDLLPYAGKLVTRPLKLENGLALKRITEVRHIMDVSGSLSLHLKATNNLKDWAALSSLGGIPWKYYKMEYDFADLDATDTFAGTVLVTEEVRIDKIR